jgi:mRNA interferase HigB
MEIVNKGLISRFIAKHANSQNPINRWVNQMEETVFANHNELKSVFPSADYVGGSRYVFNIKGNDYRIVAVVLFAVGLATVCFIGTHSEYDKIDCLTIIQ